MPRRVELGRDSSDLFQGNGSRHRLAELLSQKHERILVVSDRQVESALRCKTFPQQEWLVVPPGETSKSLETASLLWSELCSLGADRDTAMVAVGGGMIGDLTGFVAGTYLRGLPFYSLPTSLLAMVDASVGGKVGIDLPEGKNLVGQFYPARAVAIDPELLDSLPVSEWSSGMAEVIKHAILQGDPFWSTLLDFPCQAMSAPAERQELLAEAVEVKLRVVAQDPYERTGQRATLNLGHTFGHAFEWCSGYELRHGEAVALGLLAAVRLSRSLGLLEQDFEVDLRLLLERWSLPTTLPQPDHERWAWERLCEAFRRDKKCRDGRWSFILPTRPGGVVNAEAPNPSLVQAAVESLKDLSSEVVR